MCCATRLCIVVCLCFRVRCAHSLCTQPPLFPQLTRWWLCHFFLQYMQLARRAFRLVLLPHNRKTIITAATRCMTTTSSNKRSMVKIGTHSGAFHCDEALGCFLLRQLDQYKDAEIVRTRDPAILREMDVVVDVGGVYDPGMCWSHHLNRRTHQPHTMSPQLPCVLIIINASLPTSLAMASAPACPLRGSYTSTLARTSSPTLCSPNQMPQKSTSSGLLSTKTLWKRWMPSTTGSTNGKAMQNPSTSTIPTSLHVWVDSILHGIKINRTLPVWKHLPRPWRSLGRSF